MQLRHILLSPFLLVPLPAAALCVGNGTANSLYFTVEGAETGTRVGAALEAGEILCLPESRKGVVAAFESSSSIEGCSRLAAGSALLLAYGRFDRCTWASHPGRGETAGE